MRCRSAADGKRKPSCQRATPHGRDTDAGARGGPGQTAAPQRTRMSTSAQRGEHLSTAPHRTSSARELPRPGPPWHLDPSGSQADGRSTGLRAGPGELQEGRVRRFSGAPNRLRLSERSHELAYSMSGWNRRNIRGAQMGGSTSDAPQRSRSALVRLQPDAFAPAGYNRRGRA